MNYLARSLAVAPVLMIIFAAGVSASPPAASNDVVARALDQKLAGLTLQEQEVPEALLLIGQKAGVKISIEDRSADLLPWGKKTRLKQVTIEQGATLREALAHVLDPLGMMFEAKEDGLVVVATPPLRRINRRATWDDLKLLRRCTETECSAESFKSFKFQYRITRKVNAQAMLADQIPKAGRGSIAQVLETAAAALGWVWFPNGDHIVIRTFEAQIANRMSRRITCRYINEPLTRILLDLADKAKTHITFEPGLMLKLPANVVQSTDLILQHSSIRQAFEVLAANTGIAYKIQRNDIHISLSAHAGGRQPRRSSSPYVGKVCFKSGDGLYSYDFLLREEDLPEDVLEYRQQLIEECIQRMRSDMSPDETRNDSGKDG